MLCVFKARCIDFWVWAPEGSGNVSESWFKIRLVLRHILAQFWKNEHLNRNLDKIAVILVADLVFYVQY